MDLSKIDFAEISNEQFYEIVNRTEKEDVLKCFLENSTNEQQKYLSKYGETGETREMFSLKNKYNTKDFL